MARQVGRYERTVLARETVSAFVPNPSPPTNPRLSLDAGTGDLLRSAEQKLSRLDLAGEMVPSIDRFFYAFVRKEAVNKDRARPRRPKQLRHRCEAARAPAATPDGDAPRDCEAAQHQQTNRSESGERPRAAPHPEGDDWPSTRSHLRLQRVPGATARGKTCSSRRATRTGVSAPWQASWQALIRVTMRLRESRFILRRRDRRRGRSCSRQPME